MKIGVTKFCRKLEKHGIYQRNKLKCESCGSTKNVRRTAFVDGKWLCWSCKVNGDN